MWDIEQIKNKVATNIRRSLLRKYRYHPKVEIDALMERHYSFEYNKLLAKVLEAYNKRSY